MFKKSQAALEFLTTYAWAFLVILIMIGALTYFGIFKPTDILPERCNFGTEIGCMDYVINYGTITGVDDGSFNIKLKNSVGEPIIIAEVGGTGFALSTDSSETFTCTLNEIDDAAPPGDGLYTWKTGATVDFEFTGCNTEDVGFRPGNKDKIFVTITYYLAKSGTDSGYEHEVKGEVYATVR